MIPAVIMPNTADKSVRCVYKRSDIILKELASACETNDLSGIQDFVVGTGRPHHADDIINFEVLV